MTKQWPSTGVSLTIAVQAGTEFIQEAMKLNLPGIVRPARLVLGMLSATTAACFCTKGFRTK